MIYAKPFLSIVAVTALASWPLLSRAMRFAELIYRWPQSHSHSRYHSNYIPLPDIQLGGNQHSKRWEWSLPFSMILHRDTPSAVRPREASIQKLQLKLAGHLQHPNQSQMVH
jgi:hypothetical protein